MSTPLEILEKTNWTPVDIPETIPQGDMPGDKVSINENHIKKANLIMPKLLSELKTSFSRGEKCVVCVCGGSGVGKSEIASLLSFYLNQMGIGAYTLSGDNYPRRIPMYNDAERLRYFRTGGLEALVAADLFTPQVKTELEELQLKETDADKSFIEKYPWFETYLYGALSNLRSYLGTDREINFKELTKIIAKFKSGESGIYLKRMGRAEGETWYDKVDFSNINVMIIEWTHGNSDNYAGVDIPVFLNSTPQETMEHRKKRNRDGKVDSPFTTRVLEIEQEMLASQAHKARIIVSKVGELLTFEQYKQL